MKYTVLTILLIAFLGQVPAHAAKPPKPTGFTAVGKSPTEITLTWNDVAGETGYRIRYKKTGGVWSADINIAKDVTTHTLNGLAEGTKYIAEICAVNGAELSNAASADAFTKLKTPTNVNADAIFSTAAFVSWSDESGKETSYQIEHKTGATTGIVNAAANTEYREIYHLTMGATYQFRVRAHNVNTDSAWSAQVTVTLPVGAPKGVTATTKSDSEIEVAWSAVAGVKDYRVYAKKEGAVWAVAGTVVPPKVTLTHSGLAEATKYWYYVVGRNAAGDESAPSNFAQTTTNPKAPTVPTINADSPTKVTMRWTDNSKAETGYEVQRKTGAAFQPLITLAANSKTHADESAPEGTKISYQVRSIIMVDNKVQGSSWLALGTVTTKPKAPTNLSLSLTSTTKVSARWTDNSGVEAGYEVAYKKKTAGAWTTKARPQNATDAAINGLTVDTEYVFRVRCYISHGGTKAYSDWTAEAEIKTGAGLEAPSDLTAEATGADKIKLTWYDNATTEVGFRIERKTTGGYAKVHETAVGVTRWTDTGLTEGTTYTYHVQAFKADEKSDWSNEASATTELKAPTGLTATAEISGKEVSLSWTDNSGVETGYRVDRRPANGAWQQVKELGVGAHGWKDTGLTDLTDYEYRVYAYKDAIKSSYATVSIKTRLAQPTNVTVTVGDLGNDINITWKDNSEHENYFVIRYSPTGGATTDIGVSANETTKRIKGLTEQTEYRVMICSYVTGPPVVVSAWSAPATATTTLAAPTDLSVASVHGDGTKLVLDWTDNSSVESGYQYERDGTVRPDLAANTKTHTDTGLTNATEYTYRVRCFKGAGAARKFSPWSMPVKATTGEPNTEKWFTAAAVVVGYSFGDFFESTSYGPGGYHDGIDAIAPPDTKTHTPLAGTVVRRFQNSAATEWSVVLRVQVGGNRRYLYMGHMKTAVVAKGAEVSAGDQIGTIQNTNFGAYGTHTHVYLSKVTSFDVKDNVNPLAIFAENRLRDPAQNRPQILDRKRPVALDSDDKAIQYRPDGGGDCIADTQDIPKVGKGYKIKDQVDATVETKDEMGHERKPAAIYSISYYVESKAKDSHGIKTAAAPYVLHKCDKALYDGSIAKTNDIFDTAKVKKYIWDRDTCGHFLVTNTKGTNGDPANVDKTQHWNTTARNVTSGEDNGVNKNNAGGAHNAYFQDGHYILHVTAYDLVGATQAKDNVWVENWAPIITKLEIWQDSDKDASTGSAPHTGYESQIYSFTYSNPTDGSGKYPAKTGVDYLKAAQKAIAGSGKDGRKIWIQVQFSESMDDQWDGTKIQLDPQGSSGASAIDSDAKAKWSKTTVENDTLTATVTIPPNEYKRIDSKGKLGDDHSSDGEVVVIARDLAKKKLDANSDGSSDDADRQHKIKIDTKHNESPRQNPKLQLKAVNP